MTACCTQKVQAQQPHLRTQDSTVLDAGWDAAWPDGGRLGDYGSSVGIAGRFGGGVSRRSRDERRSRR